MCAWASKINAKRKVYLRSANKISPRSTMYIHDIDGILTFVVFWLSTSSDLIPDEHTAWRSCYTLEVSVCNRFADCDYKVERNCVELQTAAHPGRYSVELVKYCTANLPRLWIKPRNQLECGTFMQSIKRSFLTLFFCHALKSLILISCSTWVEVELICIWNISDINQIDQV